MVGNEADFLQKPCWVLVVLGKNQTFPVKYSDFVEVANFPNFGFLSIKWGERYFPTTWCAVRKNARKGSENLRN